MKNPILSRVFPGMCFTLFAILTTGQAEEVRPVHWQRIESSTEGLLPPPPGDGFQATASVTIDVDSDGDEDFCILGRRGEPAITLWRRMANEWKTEVVEPEALRIEAGGAVLDIDNDGDPDILFGGDSSSNQMWWWENPHPAKGRWSRHLIKNEGGKKHHDQLFGDFDGDGKVELVSWNQKGAQALLLFEIPEHPLEATSWPYSVIYHWEEGEEHEGLAKADINGDGLEDIIGGGLWFSYSGHGTFQAHRIGKGLQFTRAQAGQFIEGGVPEVIFVPGDADGPLVLFEKNGDTWKSKVLLDLIIHGHSLQTGDINQDGHLDILVGEMGQWGDQVNNSHARVILLFGNGRGDFEKQLVSTGQGVHEARLADLDGDGDLDILGKPYRHNAPKLVVWFNLGSM